MSLHLWPIAGRADLLRAFRPGESSTREAPFRTLRAHGWVSPGRSVTTRSNHRATGRLSLFSSLNVTAARLAREGRSQPAKAIAQAAARVERSPAFAELSRLLSGQTATVVAQVLNGHQPDWPALTAVLRSVARVAEGELSRRPVDDGVVEIRIGRVAEVQSEYLVLEGDEGRTAVPINLARAAHRDDVGDCLALVSDQVDAQQMIVRAVPALELTAPRFTPFGRSAAITTLTRHDERLLSGTPAPLRVLVPVVIER